MHWLHIVYCDLGENRAEINETISLPRVKGHDI